MYKKAAWAISSRLILHDRTYSIIKYLKHNFTDKPIEVKTPRIVVEPKDLDVKKEELVFVK